MNLEIPGVGISRMPDVSMAGNTRNNVRGKPPVARRQQNHADRESQRILSSIQNNNFGVNGTAVNGERYFIYF